MNKHISFLIIAILFATNLTAQDFSFGIKGGPSFASGGTITGNDSGVGNFDGTVDAESKVTFHAGAFFEVRFGKFLLRPEFIYSTMETEFPFPTDNAVYSVDKISVPFLVGYNVWGPIDIYAGPAYQNILDASLEGTQPADDEIVVQNTPISGQIGIKGSFVRFELDLRYDHLLSTAEEQNLDLIEGGPGNPGYGINLANFDDSRLNQIMLSIGFKIFDSTAKPGRRKGGSCYF